MKIARMCGFGVLTVAQASLAYTADAETAAPNAGANTLDEVIVTVSKREENLSRFAGALVAVTGSSLKESGVKDVTGLGSAVAGVMFNNNGAVTSPSIRGIGSTQYSPLGGPAVGFNVDGVPVDGMIATNAAFYDLARVEVLKGPQGTLYGKNATAGVINVVSNRPKLDKFDASADIEVGKYASRRIEAAVNVPLGGAIALRLSGLRDEHNGYLSDGYNDADNYAGRLQLLLKPSDRFSFLLAGDYLRQGGRGAADVPLPLGSRGTDANDPWKQSYYPARQDAHRRARIWGVHGELDADLGFASLFIVPSYRESVRNHDISYEASFRADADEAQRQTSVELRLSNQVGPIQWLLGGYYFNGTDHYNADYLNPSVLAGEQTHYEDGTLLTINGQRSSLPQQSRAGFGRLVWSAADTLRLSGGLRYTEDERRAEPNMDYTLHLFPGGPPVVFGTPFPVEPVNLSDPRMELITTFAKARFYDVSYKGGAEYDLTADHMLYANVSTGYKSGGINDGVATTYKPELLTAYEIGLRSTLPDQKLRMHLNAFYWNYKNHQEGGVYFVPPIGILYQITNIPKGRIEGADFEATWQPTSADSLNVQLSYLSSNTGPFSLPTGVQSAQGHPFVNSPKWTFNAGYGHTFGLGTYTLEPRVQTHVVSSYNTDFRFDAMTRQPGYTKTDFNLTLRPAAEKWYVAAYVRNVENKAVIVASQAAPGPGAPRYWGFLGDQRTYGVRGGIDY